MWDATSSYSTLTRIGKSCLLWDLGPPETAPGLHSACANKQEVPTPLTDGGAVWGADSRPIYIPCLPSGWISCE